MESHVQPVNPLHEAGADADQGLDDFHLTEAHHDLFPENSKLHFGDATADTHRGRRADAGGRPRRLLDAGSRQAPEGGPDGYLRIFRDKEVLLTLGPHSLALTEAALDLLRQMGVDRDDAVLAYLALIRFISGTGSAEDHVRRSGHTQEEWREDVRTVYGSVPTENFPHVFGMSETLANWSFDEQFEFGIDAMSAGVVAKARRISSQRSVVSEHRSRNSAPAENPRPPPPRTR